jgi:hypothetical protein
MFIHDAVWSSEQDGFAEYYTTHHPGDRRIGKGTQSYRFRRIIYWVKRVFALTFDSSTCSIIREYSSRIVLLLTPPT